MKNFTKNFVWAVVTLMLISFLFSSVGGTNQKEEPKNVTLSEVAERIQRNEVKSIVLSGEEASITFNDDSKATVKKEADASFTESLTNLGVTAEAMKTIALEVKEESGWAFWAGMLLPALLPLLAVGFIFWLMFRQARSGASQAFSFGRSGMKLSGVGKEKYTFADPAVQRMLNDRVLLQADVTANSEDDKALLKRFGLYGPLGILFFDA